MRTRLDTVKKALVVDQSVWESSAEFPFLTFRQDKTGRGSNQSHLFQVHAVVTATGSVLLGADVYFAATVSCGDCANNPDSLFDCE